MHTRRDSKPATSIGATAHWADRLFRLRKALTKFPPQAVVSAFPTACRLGDEKSVRLRDPPMCRKCLILLGF